MLRAVRERRERIIEAWRLMVNRHNLPNKQVSRNQARRAVREGGDKVLKDMQSRLFAKHVSDYDEPDDPEGTAFAKFLRKIDKIPGAPNPEALVFWLGSSGFAEHIKGALACWDNLEKKTHGDRARISDVRTQRAPSPPPGLEGAGGEGGEAGEP